MTSPTDVVAFHAEFDRHPDDRVRLFEAVARVVPQATKVLYPGSYVDIAPSVWFDDVTYVDLDKRAKRFFACVDEVGALIAEKRRAAGQRSEDASLEFHHQDYREAIPVEEGSTGLVISLYAGFISEHCTDALRIGGTLLVNPSHGDAAMASIDPRYELTGTVISSDGAYRINTDHLETYLVPKRPQEITVQSLRDSGRGVGYTRSPFAYLFTRVR